VSTITLSKKAISDLRIALQKSYGEVFERGLSDEEVQKIGVLLLTTLAESLKMEITNPELFTRSVVDSSGSVIDLTTS
jgi:hypothetical protein